MGSRWRKTLALSEKQKQALEFGKDFAAALSLLLSIGFKCLKKPTRCTSSTWHLHLFFQQCQDFCNAVDKLNDKLTVMTDYQSLGMLLQNVFLYRHFYLWFWGSGAEAPIFALDMLLQAVGKEHCMKHVLFDLFRVCCFNLLINQL